MNQKEKEKFILDFVKWLSGEEILLGHITNSDDLERVTAKELKKIIKEYTKDEKKL